MYEVTLFPGDGIGPDLVRSMKTLVLDTMKLPIVFDSYDVGLTSYEKTGEVLPEAALDSFRKNHVALKAPITTPIGQGFRSINVSLRMAFDLYANIRPIQAINHLPTKFPGTDFVIFRENTEDLYIGEETQISPDEAVAVKRITKHASERIIRQAFEYALAHDRAKVTAVHKANILKLTDGLFLKVFREVQKDYPTIKTEEIIVDNCSMQLVMRPEAFDILVMPNLYGDILSDLGAGLVGGLGLIPSVNKNEDYAMFEAVHGSAPDIAGKDLANPTAFLLATSMLLDHLGMKEEAKDLKKAVYDTLAEEDSRTRDLGGPLGTLAFTDKVKSRLTRDR